jgi:hypothetical protein
MTDELVPFAEPSRLPAPADLKETLRRELSEHVTAERAARGDVHQPEDTWALVRKLGGAFDAFSEYANAFKSAAAMARRELDAELIAAVGESDGVPLAGMAVPDVNDTEIKFSLDQGNQYTIDADQVIQVVVANLIEITRDTEPEWDEDLEDAAGYRARYETWMAGLMVLAIDHVMQLGSYAMQVSKVRAFAADLAAAGADSESAVVTGAITRATRYKGVKMERKERRKR